MEEETRNTLDAIELQVEQSRQAVLEAQALLASTREQQTESASTRDGLKLALERAEAQLSELSIIATTATTARSQITDEQAVIAAKSTHIQGAQEHADRVRAELDRIQTSSAQTATEAEGYKARAQSANDTAAELLSNIRAYRITAESDLALTATARDSARSNSEVSKALAEKADAVEAKIAAYEARLAELEKQSRTQLETIIGLLPGATAAGLAHAFDDRRKTFLKPSTNWQWLFVGSVIALVALAATGLWSVYKNDVLLGWDNLARLWLARLPIAAALVWLALHASRESALAKRLEEDYGYKAAIAASFLGFQKQMADIESSVREGSPLSKLCADTLATIGSPPGRIYDKHHLTITPAGELAKAAAQVIATTKDTTK